MRRFLIIAAALLLGVGLSASAVATVAEPAGKYGLCVNKKTGLVRALERTALQNSWKGKCRTTETKVTVPSVTGISPNRVVEKWPGGVTVTCVKASETASTLTRNCTSVTASPSASPSASPAG